MKNKLLSLGTLVAFGVSTTFLLACGQDQTKVNLMLEKAKISTEFDTVDAANKKNQDFTIEKVNANVTTKFKKITEVKANRYGLFKPFIATLAKGVAIKSVIVKRVYDSKTKTIILKVSINHQKETQSQDVQVKFETKSIQQETNKLNSEINIKNSLKNSDNGQNFAALSSGANNVKSKFLKLLEIANNNKFFIGQNKLLLSPLSDGILIAKIQVKEIYDIASKKIVLIITLTKNNVQVNRGTAVKIVTVKFGTQTAQAQTSKLRSEIGTIKSPDMVASGENFATLKASSVNVKSKFLKISEFATNNRFLVGVGKLLSKPLLNGVLIDSIKVKEKYNNETRKMIIRVTLVRLGNASNKERATKDVIVTFGGESLKTELNKFKDTITNFRSAAIVVFHNLGKGDDASSVYKKLGSTRFVNSSKLPAHIRSNATIKVPYDPVTRKVVLTLKLTKDSSNGIKYGSNIKDVTITFLEPNLKMELSNVKSRLFNIENEHIAAFQNLSKGVNVRALFDKINKVSMVATYQAMNMTYDVIIKTPYDPQTRIVVLTFKLTKFAQDNTKIGEASKDIKISFLASDLRAEIVKIQNVITDVPHYKITDFQNLKVGTDAKTIYDQLGAKRFTPNSVLASDVTYIAVVKKAYDPSTKTIVLKVTLNNNANVNWISNTKDVTITFLEFTLGAELARLKNTIANVANSEIANVRNIIRGASAKSFYDSLGTKRFKMGSMFTKDISHTAIVQKVYKSSTRTIVLKVSIIKTDPDGTRHTRFKNITITFLPIA